VASSMVSLRVEDGLLAAIDAARGDQVSRAAWIAAACSAALRGVPEAPRSGLPANRDVVALGWYRPGSVEAKQGVEVDERLLERARR